jgi:hypothetical protein
MNVKVTICHSEPERSEGEESRCYLKESVFTRNETLRSRRSLRVTYIVMMRHKCPTNKGVQGNRRFTLA